MSLYFMAASLLKKSTDNLPQVGADDTTLKTFLTIFFIAIGSLALLMMVIAGFRYVISAGNPDKAADARRMIIYTAVGLILSASAATIVNFVLGKTP